MKRLNGILLPHRKRTESRMTEDLPMPEIVRIPMLMHMGAPCEPCVKPGDPVTVGQKIGSMIHEFSAPIHASVSGKVKTISQYQTQNSKLVPCVEIEPDGLQTLYAGIRPPKLETKEDLIRAVRESGCVGLGGAGFPTHVKLNTANQIDMLILNGAEMVTRCMGASSKSSPSPSPPIRKEPAGISTVSGSWAARRHGNSRKRRRRIFFIIVQSRIDGSVRLFRRLPSWTYFRSVP